MDQVATLEGQIKAEKYAEAKTTLVQLKLKLTELTDLPPNPPSADPTGRNLACKVYENAVLLSVGLKDTKGFSRHFAQLKPFYADATTVPSDLRCPILGLNLLLLLINNELDGFHCELELLSDAEREDPAISFPVRLEQYLAMGSYNQVLEARANIPHPAFEYFMSLLMDTVRDFIAECTEVAYTSLSVEAAKKMLMLDSDQALEHFIQDSTYVVGGETLYKYSSWVVDGGMVHFKTEATTAKSAEVPSMRLISECLSYATELERIV